MSIVIASIVEGHGEVEALPILIRRLLIAWNPPGGFEIMKPVRIPKSKLLQPNEIERAAEWAARKTRGSGGVLLVLDSDKDCPAEIGPVLLARIRAARADVPSAVVVLKSEFEALFLAGAASLRGTRGLPEDLAGPPDPEAVRDAKGWLSARMPAGSAYRETLHQAALTEVVDLDLVSRSSPSFRKLRRDLVRLCEESRPRA